MGDWFQDPLWIPNSVGAQVPCVKNGVDQCIRSALHFCKLPTTEQKQYRYLFKKSTYKWTQAVETRVVRGSAYIRFHLPVSLNYTSISIYFPMRKLCSSLPCLTQRYFSATSKSPRCILTGTLESVGFCFLVKHYKNICYRCPYKSLSLLRIIIFPG